MDIKPLRPILLLAQQELVDKLDDSYDVRIEAVSEPKVPTLIIRQHRRAIFKVYPMKEGRFRILDIEESKRLKEQVFTYVNGKHLMVNLLMSRIEYQSYAF
jgi:hypothetical protein